MKKISLIALIFMSLNMYAQKKMVLINNIEIFNGIDEKTFVANILIEDNLISKISEAPIVVANTANVEVINGKGKFLIPGLIDAHAHTTMDAITPEIGVNADIGYINLYSAYHEEKQLMRGFTTVRDMGGNPFALKKAIDQGLIKGPRIYPSGAMISQTGGHGDFRQPNEIPVHYCGEITYMESCGMMAIADGYDQVLVKTREQLRQGATQIKLAAGGGVSSDYDPLDVAQYTKNEFQAAVDAADNWGTYVTVHAYTPKAIRQAVDAGVKCIEHGQLIDEATAKLMAEKNIWWCLQPFLDDEDAIPFPDGSKNRAKQLEMTNGTDNAYKLAKKYKIKTAWGTDCLFDAKLTTRQGAQLAKLIRWYTPYEILKMATSTNAELLAMSGPRNPYPKKLGVISEDAYADLVIVNGNPLNDIHLIENPEENFLLIMKDGKIYKNLLDSK